MKFCESSPEIVKMNNNLIINNEVSVDRGICGYWVYGVVGERS